MRQVESEAERETREGSQERKRQTWKKVQSERYSEKKREMVVVTENGIVYIADQESRVFEQWIY